MPGRLAVFFIRDSAGPAPEGAGEKSGQMVRIKGNRPWRPAFLGGIVKGNSNMTGKASELPEKPDRLD